MRRHAEQPLILALALGILGGHKSNTATEADGTSSASPTTEGGSSSPDGTTSASPDATEAGSPDLPATASPGTTGSGTTPPDLVTSPSTAPAPAPTPVAPPDAVSRPSTGTTPAPGTGTGNHEVESPDVEGDAVLPEALAYEVPLLVSAAGFAALIRKSIRRRHQR